MQWKMEDATPNWLKVRSAVGRAYFIPWTQESAFLAINLLSVIPADPAESTQLDVLVRAGELPELVSDLTATSALRDAELAELWRAERRRLERRGDLEALPGRRRPRSEEPGMRRRPPGSAQSHASLRHDSDPDPVESPKSRPEERQ